MVRCNTCGYETSEGWHFDADRELGAVEIWVHEWAAGLHPYVEKPLPVPFVRRTPEPLSPPPERERYGQPAVTDEPARAMWQSYEREQPAAPSDDDDNTPF